MKRFVSILAALMLAILAVVPMAHAESTETEEEPAYTETAPEAETPPVGETAPEEETVPAGVTYEEETVPAGVTYEEETVPAGETSEEETVPLGQTYDEDETISLESGFQAVEAYTMYVNSSNGLGVNVRVQPTKNSTSMYCLGVGFPVSVIGWMPGTDWMAVKTTVNGVTSYGYMMSKFLQSTDVSTQRQSFLTCQNVFTVTVRPSSANGRVNLWATASKSGAEIRTLTKGERLTVLAYSHAWYRVMDSQGNLGYVAKAYVKK